MERAHLLRNIPLFEALTDEELEVLATRFDERDALAGVDVFRAGDDGATLYVIQEGAVEITMGEGSSKTLLTTLHAGQFFGELALLDDAPRSATATTIIPSRLLALARDDFLSFLKNKPEAAAKILAEMAKRLRETNALFSRQVSRDVLEEADEHLPLGQRVADAVAAFGGSWTFIFFFSASMFGWMVWNGWMGEQRAFDPFPFILLNLALSTCAALQAPVIMMSQNRQATKDKLLAQNDYLVNLKAELGIQQILRNQVEILARLERIERQSPSRSR